jgi:hypothetical protein
MTAASSYLCHPALAKKDLDTKRSSLKPKTLSKAQWLLDDRLN